jgi:hypothetical protein
LYQGKLDDKILVPANLLLLPLDNARSINLNSFSFVGADLLKSQEAFSKAKSSTKSFSTNLFQNTSQTSTLAPQIENFYQNDTLFTESLNYGLVRQHNLITGLNTNVSPSLDPGAGEKLSDNVFLRPYFEKKLNQLGFKKSYSGELNLLQAPTLDIFKSNLSKITDYSNTLFSDNVSVPAAQDLKTFLPSQPDLDNTKQTFFQGRGSKPTISSTKTIEPQQSKKFNPSSEDGKLLLTEQAPRFYSNLKPNKGHLNFTNHTSTFVSNLINDSKALVSATPLSSYNNNYVLGSDNAVVYKSLSSSHADYNNTHSIKSSNPYFNGLDFLSKNKKVILKNWSLEDPNTLENQIFDSKTSVVNLLTGPREKAPTSVNATYWTLLWQNTNSSLRLDPILQVKSKTDKSYLPLLTPYSEYDFANYQALQKLEESFWESFYPTYNYYEYLPLNNLPGSYNSGHDSLLTLKNYSNTQLHEKTSFLTTELFKEKGEEGVNHLYSNVVQTNNFLPQILHHQTGNFFNLAAASDLTENDDSTQNIKGILALNMGKNNYIAGASLVAPFPSSYLSVVNSFRGDYSNSYWQSISDIQQKNFPIRYQTTLGFDRLSNTPVIQSSAKNLLVNQSAFQKVFRARFDEGRANVNSLHFANVGPKQQFLTDYGTPYTKLLRKNLDHFYNTPLYKKKTYSSGGELFLLNASLKSSLFDFPFLLSQTSDLIRHS